MLRRHEEHEVRVLGGEVAPQQRRRPLRLGARIGEASRGEPVGHAAGEGEGGEHEDDGAHEDGSAVANGETAQCDEHDAALLSRRLPAGPGTDTR